ncbi:MAG TPA: elongation factor 4 [Myxococcales bacterium]|nr:elongation factor 4 [Deltaproteobacteria bacterium]MBU51221.1 elongation factor 4 [Deltaproteobacteria bacterium]HAA53640.1 elongation factor 4 [Myxococcales bacterium]|tara:strand:+ start:2181 stop:3980 length:1800 start_codon:yes stop_codon:yes gene_type:complete
MSQENIRNFCIIAHIDHGKSTLADRILEYVGAVNEREKQEQFLDGMDLERERGITIKASSVRLDHKHTDGKEYRINLIDTPGHVDFMYEVSRALEACEGALLVVDASQGVEAQTLANVYMAIDADLEVVPVLNKIDLPSAEPERISEEIEDVIGLDASKAPQVSAKTGLNIEQVINAIIEQLPPPTGKEDEPLRALIFDSWYDAYRGVTVLLRVVDGSISVGDKVKTHYTNQVYEVQSLGMFTPHRKEVKTLECGEVGFLTASIKNVEETRIGDTITSASKPTDTPLPGFKEVKSMVFSGLYPVDSADYESLRDALDKLRLNDASFSYEPETSVALGFGFRCGFLGLLHMEIIQERLEREYNLDLITTSPSVIYHCYLKDGEMIHVDNPSQLPDPMLIDRIEEPYIEASVFVPTEFIGAVIKLCEERRGLQQGIEYIGTQRAAVKYHLPMAEVAFDFYDRLKSVSRGYASLDYEMLDYRAGALVRLDILINGDPVDALSIVVHKQSSYGRGQALTKKLKEVIPRQLFEVAIQAAIGNKVIARTTQRALRKNVTAKCYGGDISRKRKLLEKQKAGKKRMKQVGSVEIPQQAFLAVLKLDD